MARTHPPVTLRFGKLFSALATLALAAVMVAGASAAEFKVDLLDIQTLLRKGNYDALEARFAALEQAATKGDMSDQLISRAYSSFAVIDPKLEKRLERWVRAKPDSHRPYIATGFYYRNLGWHYRGSRYAHETSDKRVNLMGDNFRIAETNFKAALERRPNSGVAYGGLINMQMAAGDEETIRALFLEGIQAAPDSFSIRRSVFGALLPWWGGHRQDPAMFAFGEPLPELSERDDPVPLPEALLRFDQFLDGDPDQSRHLAPLTGLADYTVGLMLYRNDRNLEAAQYYRQAITHGDYWFYYRQQGLNFSQMKRYNDAVASYTRSLELWPDNPDTLERRAWAYRALKAYDKADADVDLALRLDPMNPDLLQLKSYNLWSQGRFKQALRFLDDALEYGDLDADIWDARGRLYMYKLNKPKKAIPDLKRATELEPTNHEYWYNYAGALFRAIDCEAVKAYRRYLDVCPKYGNDCFEEGVKYAYEVIEHLSQPAYCG